jgi:hypothetical protein
MPPHTEELMLPVAGSLTSVVLSPASLRRGYLPAKDDVPFLDLQQPFLEGLSGGNDNDLFLTYHKLCARYDTLLLLVEESESSPVRDACLISLRTRMPLFLKHAGLHIESLEKSLDDSARVVSKLRSTLAMVAAVQYLDTIESGMTCESRATLDEQLACILNKVQGIQEKTTTAINIPLCFQVSHWLAPALVFDLPAGAAARTSILSEDVDSLPLSLEVEPVLSFRTGRLLSGEAKNQAVGTYSVTIEQCKHRPEGFAGGNGALGVASVRVRVATTNESNPGVRVWGEEEVEKLKLKAARAVQTNAYPPKPRAFLDLYTSSEYGDSGITVTMIIKTCVTEGGDPPNLHVELFVDPEQI